MKKRNFIFTTASILVLTAATSAFAAANVFTINQVGNNNTATGSQSFSDNVATINQIGTGNSAGAIQDGRFNNTTISQNGTNLGIGKLQSPVTVIKLPAYKTAMATPVPLPSLAQAMKWPYNKSSIQPKHQPPT